LDRIEIARLRATWEAELIGETFQPSRRNDCAQSGAKGAVHEAPVLSRLRLGHKRDLPPHDA
jgi:hypothetical protein